MSRSTLNLSSEVYQYLLDVSLREPDILRRLREETATHPAGKMQIAPEQGQFMALLARLMGARRVIELGVFTGYSALAVALALPDGGCLVACDINSEYTSIAERFWQEAHVTDKIDLRIAPAADTLARMLDDGEEGTYDMAFIDADKALYDVYYELTLRLIRHGGLIILDNVFRGGAAAGPPSDNPDTAAIQRLNAKLLRDTRVHLSMIPVGDGLTLALKI